MGNVMFRGGTMRNLIFCIVLFMPSLGFAKEIVQYICTIKGVYENVSGKFVQRKEKKAIGKLLYINADTGEVTGYFRTDYWVITKFKRPDGLLTIETATGLIGDAANRLKVTAKSNEPNEYNFEYTKNWLYISGQCKMVMQNN